MENKDIKEKVKQGYGKIARDSGSCCTSGSCCSPLLNAEDISRDIGYTSVIPSRNKCQQINVNIQNRRVDLIVACACRVLSNSD